MKQIKIGFVDYTKTVFIPDPASTDGSGKTGLVAADLTVSYVRVETDNDVVVTDVTGSLNNLALLTTAHTDWGLLEVSNTLAPGLYRLDIADAVFASGAWTAVVYVMITTSAAAASPIEFELVPFDPLDGVRMGLTALPNAAADAAGGLPISDAGGLDLDTKLANTNEITVARMGALTDWINGGRLDLILDIIAADTTTDIPALIATLQTAVNDLPTNGELAAALATADDAILTALALVAGNVDDIETLLNAVALDVDAVLALTGTDGVVVAAASKTGYTLSAAGIDSNWDEVIEGTLTARQLMRVFAAALAGISAGQSTVTGTFRDQANTKDRITATLDGDGNRTGVTLDVS